MSRTYRKQPLRSNDHHDGYDDPTDIRYIGKRPIVPPKPSNQWLPREYQVIDPDWDTED